MVNPAPVSFWTQANALLRKNLTFQKRNVKSNIRLIFFPLIICILLVLVQIAIDIQLRKSKFKCGCVCANNKTRCDDSDKVCGPQYSDQIQVPTCPISSPAEWPPLLQLPAVSCKQNGSSCHFTTLFTAYNHSFGHNVAKNMFSSSLAMNDSNVMDSLAPNVLGSESMTTDNNFNEPGFTLALPIYSLQRHCPQNTSGSSFPYQIAGTSTQQQEIRCARGINLWRNSSSEINNELYKGYRRRNRKERINEIVSAFDFLNSNADRFNVTVWYNSTYKSNITFVPNALLRIPRSVNLISNAYLRFLKGPGTKMIFQFVKEMPKPETPIRLEIASIVGALFFTWVVLQLFPVILTSLVYEKQQKLRIMMKMHGLGDGPYWIISYGYFLALSAIYMLCFVIFGAVLGFKFFTLNDYSIQFVFYFIYINLQISLAFLFASFFSNVKTATVTAYIGVFGTGLLAGFLFQFLIQDPSFSRRWIFCMELYPGFALYRGLYEFAQSAFSIGNLETDGMRWKDLSGSANGMKEVLIIMVAEWIVVLFVAYYIDQVLSTGSGKSSLFFLKGFQKKPPPSLKEPSIKRQGSKVFAQMEKPDVIREREKVVQLLREPTINHAIVCDNLKKFYPGRDGNPGKFAVRELFLGVPRGECFGMLGPNGAGKSSFISMMIGLTKPTSGAAYVQGLDIRNHMDGIYTSMGVCPQHDLLWESLTGREHLLFYGRLKNLTGSLLTQAVEESLKSLNLYHGKIADKQAGKYSGGMKRRLSVAISLIGDPSVVYMDEPSTGLDPASRRCLWKVIKHAKRDRAIILTTHSMEEAEALCDRLGIFVNGTLQCVGNPKEDHLHPCSQHRQSTYLDWMIWILSSVNKCKNICNARLKFEPIDPDELCADCMNEGIPNCWDYYGLKNIDCKRHFFPSLLKGRYGGTYVFTMTTSLDHEKNVENIVQQLTPNANKIYHLSGTQKFELPKEDVKIANVFRAVEIAKRNFTVFAWGLADTTLEDVFIKVAREAEGFDTLS